MLLISFNLAISSICLLKRILSKFLHFAWKLNAQWTLLRKLRKALKVLFINFILVDLLMLCFYFWDCCYCFSGSCNILALVCL